MRRLAAAAILLALVACEETGPTRSDASLACDHFRNVMRDAGDGVLTDSELRRKLKEVEDNASIATSDIQTAARRMVAAATSGNNDALLAAAKDMDAACKAEGV